MINIKKITFLLLIVSSCISGCKKGPGEGGTGIITGKVYAYDYNAELTILRSQYYAPGEDVYIIYGNDSVYSDRTRTSYDGSYRFKYLRPGSYTVFVYSKNVITKLPPELPIKKTVNILADNQTIFVEEIEINK